MVRRLALSAAVLALSAAPAAAGQAPLRARATLGPRTTSFGQPLQARVTVELDPARVDARSVTLQASFSPYLRDGRVRRLRSDARHLQLEVTLRCLAAICLPGSEGDTRRFTFTPGLLRYRAEGRAQRQELGWPAVDVRSPLTDADRLRPRFHVGLRPLPAYDYRVRPRPASRLVLAGAGIALLAAAGLVFLALGRRAAVEMRPRARLSLGPLERALAILRHAATTGPAGERRLALDWLARVLGGERGAVTPEEASRLAWSPERPGRAELERIADRVEQGMGGQA